MLSGPTVNSEHEADAPVLDCLLAVGYVLLIALWSIVIPLHGAPDELTHLFLVEYLLHFGSVPIPRLDPASPFVGEMTGIEFSNATVWYQGLPFAHALGAAAFGKLFASLFPGHAYLAARLFNWLLGGIFALTLIRLLRYGGIRVFEARLIAVLIATIPQVTFIFAYFNHDAFGLAAVTLSLHGFLRAVRNPGQKLNAVYFGACCGLVLLAKPYAYPAFVFYALMLVVVWLTEASFPVKALLLRAIPACIVVAGPMLVWTEYAFGDVFGGSGIRYFLSVTPQADTVALGACYVFCRGEVLNWPELSTWVWLNFSSFFGVFGWMNVFFPAAVYRFWFTPLAAISFLLAFIFVARRIKVARSGNARAFFDASFVTLTILMLAGTVAASLVVSQLVMSQPQGRYLFVVVPFVAYSIALFAKGMRPTESERIANSGSVKLGVLAVLATSMLLLNIYAALFVVAPASQQWAGRSPFLSLSSGRLAIELGGLLSSLAETDKGLVITIPRRAAPIAGLVDVLSRVQGGMIQLSGWAFDAEHGEPVAAIAVFDGNKAVEVANVGASRPDVSTALGMPNARLSGFDIWFLTNGHFDPCSARVFAITQAMQAAELNYGPGICRR